jgi:hypothetical protein
MFNKTPRKFGRDDDIYDKILIEIEGADVLSKYSKFLRILCKLAHSLYNR